jgi:hypothetical protein
MGEARWIATRWIAAAEGLRPEMDDKRWIPSGDTSELPKRIIHSCVSYKDTVENQIWQLPVKREVGRTWKQLEEDYSIEAPVISKQSRSR